MKEISLNLIHLYKKLVSPWMGHNCRFYPTCSDYAHQAIREKGFVSGFNLSLKRILKCHPLHPGGFDPVER